MAISITRYVDITSGLGGATAVQARELLARLFTNNSLLPPQTLGQFTSANAVGNYFGFASEEYLRAVFYFSFVSKAPLSSPQALQFARFVPSAIAPYIIPLQNNATVLASWNPVSSGSFILTMGAHTFTLSGLDFSAAGSLTAVATILQSAIQAQSGGGAVWTSATVTYVASQNGFSYGGFFLTGGATDVVTNPLVVQAGGGGSDITVKGLLGWIPEETIVNGAIIPGAIWATGSATESITQTLTNSANASNNFGSFAFLTNLNLSLQNVYDAAIWNQTENVTYMYCQAVLPSNVVAWTSQVSPGVGAVGGIGLTLSPAISVSYQGTVTSASNQLTGLPSVSGLSIGMPVVGTDIPAGTVIQAINSTALSLTLSLPASGNNTGTYTFSKLEFPEMLPMMIEATTDYTASNSVQNYEFQQTAGLTPSVTSDANADVYDAIAVNYYGQTQQAGAQISFYQQGFLQGASITTNIVDMSPYVNEIWLKDALTVSLMNALLSLREIAANVRGIGIVINTMQSVINQALDNGTISVGKPLNNTQIQAIGVFTNDPLAWYQVQNSGYWLNVVLTSSGNVFTATYTLVYSKNDVIRKIIGSDTLI